MPRAKAERRPLIPDERDGIVLAVNSAFRKLKNLYAKIVPIFAGYGFTPPSAGVIARDLSEKIEQAIIQHCDSFKKGSGLTINQSKVIRGENYIVVNYKANTLVKSVWILWEAQDGFFSPRLKNSN